MFDGDTVDSGATSESQSPNNNLEPVEQVPEEVETIRPLAFDFQSHISEYYPESTVGISPDGEFIVFEYETSEESSEALQTEYSRIAEEYASTVEQSNVNATNLSIVTGEVQAVVPSFSVSSYIAGDIDQNAFHQTIEITGVERNE